MGRTPKRRIVIGDVFGDWTVISTAANGLVSLPIKCRCKCGNERLVLGYNLLQGSSKSCGHASRKGFEERRVRKAQERLARRSWRALLRKIDRGEGSMDPAWRLFDNFFQALGPRPEGAVLSQRDFDGLYNKQNCFWEDRYVQLERLRVKEQKTPPCKDPNRKVCPRCLTEKSLSDFYVSRATKGGKQSHCKECMRADINARAAAESPALAMLRRAQARARKKGFDFALQVSDLEPLPTHCPVFGIELTRGNGQQDPSAFSLDRVDNSRGYVPGNVVVMSYLANRLKNDGTAAQHARIAQWMREQGDASSGRVDDVVDDAYAIHKSLTKSLHMKKVAEEVAA